MVPELGTGDDVFALAAIEELSALKLTEDSKKEND